jgi:hypothetical protein
MSETEQQGSSADEGERQMTTEEAEKARAARRLRRELRKLAVEPSILDETDTEMEEQDQQQDLPAAATDAAVVAAEQADAEQAPDPAVGTSGGTAPQEMTIRENKEIPVPLNKKVVLKHYKVAEANPSGANALSAKDHPNLNGGGYRDGSNPGGESSLKGQSDKVNKAYKAAQALRLST